MPQCPVGKGRAPRAQVPDQFSFSSYMCGRGHETRPADSEGTAHGVAPDYHPMPNPCTWHLLGAGEDGFHVVQPRPKTGHSICDPRFETCDADDEFSGSECDFDASQPDGTCEPILPVGDERILAYEPLRRLFDWSGDDLLELRDVLTAGEQYRQEHHSADFLSPDDLVDGARCVKVVQALMSRADVRVVRDSPCVQGEGIAALLANLTEEQAKRVVVAWSTLPCRNAQVAAFSDTLCAALGCNNNPIFLGVEVAAKAALFYMVKYVTKDSTERKLSLSVLKDALQNTTQWGSTAENNKTVERCALHWSQRTCNNLDMEIADGQAAGIALDVKPHESSDCFGYSSMFEVCRMAKVLRTAVGNCSTAQQALQACEATAEEDGSDDNANSAAEPPDASMESSAFSSDVGGDGGEQNEMDAPRAAHGADRAPLGQRGEAYTPFLVDRDGKRVPCSPALHYLYRGPRLARLSYDEYCACVSMRRRTDVEIAARDADLPLGVSMQRVRQQRPDGGGASGSSGPDDGSDSGAEQGVPGRSESRVAPGRPPNARFEFHCHHPLAGVYYQVLNSKLRCPRVGGAKPPRPPRRPPSGRLSSAWKAQYRAWAEFMVANFVPWPTGGKLDPDVPDDSRSLQHADELPAEWLDLQNMSLPAPPPLTEATLYSWIRQLQRQKWPHASGNAGAGYAATSRISSTELRELVALVCGQSRSTDTTCEAEDASMLGTLPGDGGTGGGRSASRIQLSSPVASSAVRSISNTSHSADARSDSQMASATMYARRGSSLPGSSPSQTGTQYEIEALLDTRQEGENIEYLVSWKGWDSSWDTWEPAKELPEGCIAAFHAGRTSTSLARERTVAAGRLRRLHNFSNALNVTSKAKCFTVKYSARTADLLPPKPGEEGGPPRSADDHADWQDAQRQAAALQPQTRKKSLEERKKDVEATHAMVAASSEALRALGEPPPCENASSAYTCDTVIDSLPSVGVLRSTEHLELARRVHAKLAKERFEVPPLPGPSEDVRNDYNERSRRDLSGRHEVGMPMYDFIPEFDESITPEEYNEQVRKWKEKVEATPTGQPPPIAPLNMEQRKVCNALLPILLRQRQLRMSSMARSAYAPLLETEFSHSNATGRPSGLHHLLIGPAGTGKTEMLKCLEDVMLRHNLGRIVFTAWTGVASSLLPHGLTVRKLTGLDTADYRKHTTPAVTLKFHTDCFRKYAGNPEQVGLLVLDEVSMNGASMLWHFSNKLQDLFHNPGHEFGGVPCLFVGDFFQLPPSKENVQKGKNITSCFKGVHGFCLLTPMYPRQLHESLPHVHISSALSQLPLQHAQGGRNSTL